jgi:phage gp36-like protein
MAYATKQDMIDRFGLEEVIAITDRANPPAGVIDESVLTKALENATAEVNSEAKLTGIINQTEQLANITCAIARYHLSDPCSDRVRKDYEDQLVFLRRVADGRSLLIGQDAAAPATQPADTIIVTAPPRIFTRESLKDF